MDDRRSENPPPGIGFSVPPARSLVLGIIGLTALGFLIYNGVAWGQETGEATEPGIIATLLSSELESDAKLDAVKNYFIALGPLAPLVYILFVTVEVVVAPLPGLMLYAPGGIVFGGFLGGLYSLIGNVLGAGIACAAMRFLGARFAERYIERKALQHYADQLAERGLLVIALLRVNPLTSSDLVSYASGLTRIPTWKVMVGTMIGMAPLCWAQSYLADNLLTAFPSLLYPLLIACIIYAGVVLYVLHSLRNR